MSENIIKVNYEDEMQQSYIDYAMSVIVQRALPDVRDGLKPVHRRILYTMGELKNYPSKPHKKSARIVGDVLGKYHPHGDSSVYNAMVRFSQDFNMLMPLVDGHGNFGSIDGDSPAAMRYTEVRLSPVAMEMLQDLEKNIVDFIPNFDNTLKEPVVLPVKFPNLLVNGATGIAVGMRTSIPPHNLKEVIDATKATIDKPQITIKELMKYIKGPDFPTGGIVANKKDLLKIYKTGKGRIRLRAKMHVEDAGYGKNNIVVTEIPYTLAGNKTKLIEDIIKLIAEKKLNEINEIRDESSKDGMRIVIETKRGVNVEKLINKLYKITKLEDVFSVNFLAILNNRPEKFNLKGIITHYINFLKEINVRKINYELKKFEDKKEILEGLIKASDVIDLIIDIIKGSKSIKTVRDCLTKGKTEGIKFKTKKAKKEASKLFFTEKQTEAILSMQLQRLVGLEIEKLNKEYQVVDRKINYYTLLLSDEEKLKKYIKDDLTRIKKSYGEKRKTKIKNISDNYYEEDKAVTEEDIYALIDRFGYLKIIDSQSYTRANKETLQSYRKIIKLKNTDRLCLFTNDGMFHQIKMLDMKLGKINDRGIPIENLCDLKINEILLISSTEELLSCNKVVFATLNGFVKLTETEEFKTNRREIIGTKLREEDKLIDVKILKEEDREIELITKGDRALRFMIKEIPTQKRNAMGVIGINLNIGDELEKVSTSDKTDKNKRRRGAKGAII